MSLRGASATKQSHRLTLGIASLTLAMTFALPVQATTTLTGDVAFLNTNFLLHRNNHPINDQESVEAVLKYIYDNEHSFKLDLQPRLKIDFLDASLNRYLPNTAEAVFYSPAGEIRGGIGMIPWGVSHSFNPTDVINRKDLEANFYNPDRLGDFFLEGKKIFPQVGGFSDLTLTALVLPLFQETPLPENNNRFALAGTAGPAPYTLLTDQDTPGYPKALGGAFAASALVGRADLSLHYYHGPEHNPGFVLVTDSSGALRLRGFYYTIDMIGTNAEIPLAGLLFHFESAVKITSESRTHIVSNGDNNAVPATYFQAVPGVDYTIQKIGDGEIEVTLEYLKEFNRGSGLRNFRPFQNDLFLGGRYRANNRQDTTAELGIIKDVTNRETVFVARAESRLYRNLKGGLESIAVIRGSGDTPLSYFDNNSYIMAKLSTSFGGPVSARHKEDSHDGSRN